jgi:ABC-type glycerol-3-phosphate transport system substrate-binding protein
MTEVERTKNVFQSALTRRQVLKGSLLAGSAAFIAACSSDAASPTPAPTATTGAGTPPPSGPAPTTGPTPAVSYAGVTLNNHTGGYSIPAFEIGLKHWKAETGGDATFTNIPFNEKPVKIAGMIATQDSSWDLQYTYDNFMQRFGTRLLLPLEGKYTGDMSDFLPVAIKGFTTQADQVLRGLPIHFSTWLWDWNKSLFRAIGEDGDNPPDTYDELFSLVPKWKEKGIIPCVQAWQGEGGTFAAFYFKHIYNSLGHPMFSGDRTQVMFDGQEGLLAFQTIEKGLKSGYWDPAYLNITNEHDAFEVFGKGNVATVVHSETILEPGLGADHGTRQFPGIKPGTTGSSPGADGLGVGKWTRQEDACWSFFNRLYSPDVAKEICLSETLYPPTRLSIVQDPEVIAAQPLLPAYEAQAKGQSDLWSTPYAYEAVFDEVVAKMIRGEFSAAQAHDAAVTGVQELIIKYLSA